MLTSVGPLIVVCAVGTGFVLGVSLFVDAKPWVKKLAKSLALMETDVKVGVLKIDYQLGKVKAHSDSDFIGFMSQLFGVPHNIMGKSNVTR